MKSGITTDEWRDALDKASGVIIDPSVKTAQELAIERGISRDAMKRLLVKCMKSGKVEMVWTYRPCKLGYQKHTQGYRLIKKRDTVIPIE